MFHIKGATHKNWPQVEFILQTNRDSRPPESLLTAAVQTTMTVATVSLLAQSDVQLARLPGELPD